MVVKKQSDEYRAFSDLAGKLLSVPHDVVKAKLDAEKAEKKRKKSKESSASGREKDDRA
jgi:hypothetical protein